MSHKPSIAITMGDPNGIGAEIVLKAINDPVISDICRPIIYGSKSVFKEAESLTGLKCITEIIDCDKFSNLSVEPGVCSKGAGEASLFYIESAVEDAINKKVDAIVTAPITKESIHLAGSKYPGHTEMLKELTNSNHAVMLFDGGPFRVALVTIHVALSEVASLITKKKILTIIEVCNQDLKQKFKVAKPKIAVCGLNPHAGEAGAFGKEEIEEIKPAVDLAVDDGINVEGPFPADTLFYFANKGTWDLVIAMYHDQGLIPFKMHSFDTGVNVTLGLPIIRTSPDHGTAFDIAWEGVAKPTSMVEAIKKAVELSSNCK